MGEIHVMREELAPAEAAAAPAPDLDRRPRRATTSSGCSATARSFARSLEREMKKLPTLRGRTVVNVFYESSTRTSSSFELAAKRLSRRHDVDQGRRLVGRQGRVAEGHGADARRLRPGRDRHPAPADRRAAARRRGAPTRTSSTPATASTSTRRRRCSTSTRSRRSSAASRALHVAIVGDVLHSRVARSNIQALVADGRAGDARRPADADPARDRGDGLRGLARHRRDRRRRRRLRPAHAARADGRGRELRARACASTRRAGASRPSGCGRARR